jgi:predicted dehydrogenase
MTVATRPRVGFLGVGWIGRARMQALLATELVRPAGVADLDAGLREQARGDGLPAVATLDELLDLDLDGIVIATPSALHAEQAIVALERGIAVFCQKPLGRDAAETRAVLDAAARSDRLLGVDLSYRFTRAVRALLGVLGELGDLYAADLVFHNAYGPDKPWFTDPRLSGGGCLIDLGTHLVDLALWLTGSRSASVAAASLRRGGRPLRAGEVEDFALAHLELDSGITARIACSWFLPAGRDAAIECTLYGTAGAASMRNVGGSFYDFGAWRHRGTSVEPLAAPPDDWGGRALTDWATRLARDRSYDTAAAEYLRLAQVLDAIYGWRP